MSEFQLKQKALEESTAAVDADEITDFYINVDVYDDIIEPKTGY